jgi:hypothetical protein
MSEERPPDVLSSLPHSRAHHRSDKRPARPTGTEPLSTNGNGRVGWDAQDDRRAHEDRDREAQAEAGGRPGTPLLATAVEAAAELAELCLSFSARAIRAAVSRLPRP